MSTVFKGNTKTLRVLLTFILSMAIAMAVGITSVNAENECEGIHGDINDSKSFTVKTDSRWILSRQSVKLTQTKGEYDYGWMTLAGDKNSTKTHYGIYYVTVEDKSGNKVLDNYMWKSGTLKVKLKKDTTYTFTVEPEQSEYVYSRTYGYSFKAANGWIEPSTWEVIRTKNCTYCDYDNQ